jgi:hypothetical protein
MRLATLLMSTFLAIGPAAAACDGGITWTTSDEVQRGDWRVVTHGGGLFVALSKEGAIMTSPDANVWTARTAPNDNNWADIIYADGRFVAVSWDDRRPIITSADGIDWTEIEVRSSDGFGSIAHGNGTFVAVGYDIREGVATSPDGETWTVAEITSGFMNGGAVTFADGRFVLITPSGALTSADGKTWEDVGEGDLEGLWESIAHGNGRFVASGNREGSWKLTVSEDGVHWTGMRDESAGRLKFFEGWFFDDGSRRSRDGVTWEAAGTSPDYAINGIAYDGERFAGVGRDFAAYGTCTD